MNQVEEHEDLVAECAQKTAFLFCCPAGCACPSDCSANQFRREATAAARAVLAEIAEAAKGWPTERMVRAGNYAPDENWVKALTRKWRAMLAVSPLTSSERMLAEPDAADHLLVEAIRPDREVGSDEILALLSSGEYRVSPEAVEHYGVGIFHALNEMPTALASASALLEEHEYPSSYPPGQHWALDETWKILDMLKPGLLSIDARAFLAGTITGALIKAQEGGLSPNKKRGPPPAEADRGPGTKR